MYYVCAIFAFSSFFESAMLQIEYSSLFFTAKDVINRAQGERRRTSCKNSAMIYVSHAN